MIEAGKCPKCGSEDLDYGVLEPEGQDIFYPVTCKCGFKGKEYYKLTFNCFYDNNGEWVE